MTICRVVHNRENPFVQINKKALWDENLSLEAVGLWARLLSKPDNWEISVSHISKNCHVSEKKVYKIINELIENGYAFKYQDRVTGPSNRKNVFGKFHYVLFEFKTNLEEIKTMFPHAHFAHADLPLSANGHTTNIDRKETEYLKKPTQPPPPKRKEEKKKETLVGGEGSLQKLKEEFGDYILENAQQEYKIAYDKSVLRNKPIKHQMKYLRKICERLKANDLEEFIPSELIKDIKQNKSAAEKGEAHYMKSETIPGYAIEAKDNFVRFLTPEGSTEIMYKMPHWKFMQQCKPYVIKLRL